MATQNPWFSFQWGALGSAASAALARKLAPAILDPAQLLVVSKGGLSWTRVNAAAAIKAQPGRLSKLIVLTAGSAGSWVFNDCAATGDAATGNQFLSVAYNATNLVPGIPVDIDWPCNVGLVLSAIPTGGVAAISWA